VPNRTKTNDIADIFSEVPLYIEYY
jgi:hypothetical protein